MRQIPSTNGFRLQPADIDRFLKTPNPNLPKSRRGKLTGRQRQQYVRQLDRVFAHLERIGITHHNPGRDAVNQTIGYGKDKPTRS